MPRLGVWAGVHAELPAARAGQGLRPSPKVRPDGAPDGRPLRGARWDLAVAVASAVPLAAKVSPGTAHSSREVCPAVPAGSRLPGCSGAAVLHAASPPLDACSGCCSAEDKCCAAVAPGNDGMTAAELFGAALKLSLLMAAAAFPAPAWKGFLSVISI